MVKSVVSANLAGVGEGLDFIEQALKEYKFKSKSITESLLLSEESMVRLIEHAPSDGTIHISVKNHHGLATITLSAPGPEFTAADNANRIVIDDGEMGRSSEAAIRDVLLRAYEGKMVYARKGKYNFIKITAGMPERVFAKRTVIALAAAIIVGLVLLQFLPASASGALDTYLFVPIEQIFINLLMFLSAPAIFLSIITCVARYSSFSDPGRVSIKAFAGYALTSIAAVLIGGMVYSLITPGTPGECSYITLASQVQTTAPGTDFLSTLVNIVPSNIIDPFQKMDTLQILFIALVFGIALGRIGDYSAPLKNFIEAMNTLLTKVISILMNFIPVATFASTVSIILNTGSRVLLSVGEMLLTALLGLTVMMLIYCLIVFTIARLNPVTFIKKFLPAMKETFLRGSGLSALPKTMRCCKSALGISPKVYSFTIPFGATFNMDGNCVYLTIAGLFIARVCGVSLFSSDVLPLIFTVFILSVGAPITPGTTLICLSVLLNQLGVSATAASILFGINAIVEMFLAMSNATGDVAVTLAIAKSEGLLNTDVFNSKPKVRT